jgi:hypothetical protein
MSIDPNVSAVVLGVVSASITALIAAVLTFVVNRRDRRDALALNLLRETSASVATNARQLLHRASVMSHTEPSVSATSEAADEAHYQVRVGSDLLSLVGATGVQEAARLVRHHAFAIMATAAGHADPHPEYGQPPYDRLQNAIESLLRETRTQMGIRGTVSSGLDYAELTRRAS